MDSSNAVLALDLSVPEPITTEPSGPAALLRGTARGLEMMVDGRANTDAIIAALTKRLDEAPGFFRGSNVRITVEDGPLPAGCLSRLDTLAAGYQLRIVEVGPAKKAAPLEREAVPQPNLADGSAPSPASRSFEEEAPTNNSKVARIELPPEPVSLSAEPVMLPEDSISAAIEEVLDSVPEDGISFDDPTQSAAPLALAAAPDAELATKSAGPRLVIGPVRSGVILDHTGHVIVFGDVNPGAEVRATGNIIVLGRLRGTAHAGIGQDVGFILALRLEPQQVRIGRMVTRAADSDTPPSDAEIAYAAGDTIVVERYLGKLPRNLATSL
jgi:septum formation inhibitor MinC